MNKKLVIEANIGTGKSTLIPKLVAELTKQKGEQWIFGDYINQYLVQFKPNSFNAGSVAFTQSTISINEGSTATLTLERAGGSTGELTVTVDATFQSASTSDVNFTTTTVTFLDGETSKSVSVEALTDSNEESTETLTLTLTGDNIGNIDEVTVSINDTTESSTPAPSTPNNGSTGGESGGGSIHFGLLGLILMTLFRRRV